jgi:AraC-like DNA-binding protein
MRDYEFVWIMEGDVAYQCDGVWTEAPAGSVVLCRPGVRDFFRWDTQRRTRQSFLHFHVLSVPPAFPPVAVWVPVRPPEPDGILPPLIRHVLALLRRSDPNALAQCQQMLAALLTAFVSGVSDARSAPRHAYPEPVERAWKYLQERLEEDASLPISLSALADAACVSPEHLCRLFKATTGHSPAETVRLARLDRAAALLSRSNYSISEIASLCGFASPFHFSRCFRLAFGRSPRAVRQGVAAGDIPPDTRLLDVLFWK